jgi:hypothetical protein
MHLSIVFSLSLAAAANAARPNEDDTRKIWDFVKNDYIKGKVCPPGWDGGLGMYIQSTLQMILLSNHTKTTTTDDGIHTQCFVCGDATLTIHNGASDAANYCITNDEFDDLMREMWGKSCGRCIAQGRGKIGVTFGHMDDWSDDEECRSC